MQRGAAPPPPPSASCSAGRVVPAKGLFPGPKSGQQLRRFVKPPVWDPPGPFARGTPLKKGRKDKMRPYFVLERGGVGIRPSRRKGCDSAVLRTRYGIPPPEVNPDCAGPAAVQTRGNEAPLLVASAQEQPSLPSGR